ncbi:hypothetical protein T439DRAFT_380101 [Meredithblackwellia eburnea MCA 4105]
MSRQLGNYERYSLTRTLLGMPPCVALIAELTHPVEAGDLRQVINTLLARFPLLSCKVVGVDTVEPKFESVEVTPDDVLVVRKEVDEESDPTAFLEVGLAAGKEIDITKGPLWRVVGFEGIAGPSGKLSRVLLVVNHVVSDGSGSKTLFAELLRLVASPASSNTNRIDESTIAFPPTLEETIDVRPSTFHLLRVIAIELLVPKLPAFLRPAPPSPHFPGKPLVHPFIQPTRLLFATIPLSTINKLKTLAKEHGVGTLHPVLHTCLLAAFSSINTSNPPLQINSSSPISVRDPKLGHPTATGNFATPLDWTPPPHLSSPATPFWELAKAYITDLNSPSGRARAKGTMGMMKFTPDGVVELEGGSLETGWETFWRAKRDSENPWSATFEISNLGVIDVGEEEGVKNVTWAQFASPISASMAINAISLRGGALSLTLSWRDGTQTNENINTFWDTFKRILADPDQLSLPTVKISDLVD